MATLTQVIKTNETRVLFSGALTGSATKSYSAVCYGDSISVSLQVRSLTTSVKLRIYETNQDDESLLIEMPLLTSLPSNIITIASTLHLSNIRADIEYVGDCDVEVVVKALETAVSNTRESYMNSYAGTLNTATTYTGAWENVLLYNDITVFTYSTQDVTLYVDFSTDGTTTHRTISYNIDASLGTPHKLARICKYTRIRVTNASGSTATVAIQTMFSSVAKSHLTTNVSASVSDNSDAELTRSILLGRTDGGAFANVPITSEGHLEVAIHGPRLPFGSVHTENLRPTFQTDAVYGLNTTTTLPTTNASGSVTASDSAFVCSTGTSVGGAGSLQSRRRLRYRPGQGMVIRYTALFTSPVSLSYQLAGIGHAEDGLYFGYKDTVFGILYTRRGVRECRTLTVTVGSSTAENITITLNNVAFTVAVTNSASTIKTAYEISKGTYTGWKAEQVGATVVFLADAVGAKSNTYSLSGATTAVGTFAQTKAGAAVSETHIPQSTWNVDKFDGTGASGVTLDPTKFNVYQIGLQYLGAGAITFGIEIAPSGNNPEWVTCHVMSLPNTLTATSLGNPSMPFTMSAYSAGSSGTDLIVKCGSFAGFIEGQKYFTGPRFTYLNSSAAVTDSAIKALFTVRNSRVYGGRSNQSIVNLLSITGAMKHQSPCVIYIIKDATLAGTPNFASYSTDSCTFWDTAATTCTFSSNNQVIWTGMLGDTGNFEFMFEDDITVQPGETITVAAKSISGSPSFVVTSINTREDQ